MEMVEAEDQNQPKKIEEIMEVEDQDRISLLPDCLLIEIISLLGTTKEAIKTSTLSKRWQHLWTYVPNLIFKNSYDDDNHLIFDFYLFVDKTLTQCRLSNLNKFSIHTRYDTQFQLQVNCWIIYAVLRNVRDFQLTLYTDVSEFELHLDLFFNNSCFTKLSLEGCLFNPTGVISWNKLTSLSISDGDLSEDLIQSILSGSPRLETLQFHRCSGYRRIDITSKSVKKFVFIGYMTPEEDPYGFNDIIEINAPYIASLSIEDSLLLKNILLLNVSSLVEAHLDYMTGEGEYDDTPCEESEEEFFKGLILSLRHVKEIIIGTLCSKVFSCLEAKGFNFPSNLKVVDPTTHLFSYTDWDGYDSDSNESGDSEELLFADGPQSEGDEAN